MRAKPISSLGYKTIAKNREVSSNGCGHQISSKGPILHGGHAAVPKRKKGSRQGMGRVIQDSGTSNPCCSSSSLNLNWKNCLFENRDPAEIAKGVWEFGKEIGVEFAGTEIHIVKDLEGMEVRDREAASGIRGEEGKS